MEEEGLDDETSESAVFSGYLHVGLTVLWFELLNFKPNVSGFFISATTTEV